MKPILRVLSLFLILSGTVSGQYQEIHTKHFFKGYPAGAPQSNDLIIRNLYALSNNDDTKFADWVTYRVDSTSISGQGKPRNWKPDPWLDETETLEPADYNGTYNALRMDRGHQAPLGSLDGGEDYFETNYLSNITPQKAELNRGTWLKVEDTERELIAQYKVSEYIIVYTGTLFERTMPKMPGVDENATIPSGFWKIVFVPAESGLETVAFIFDQDTPSHANPIDYIVSIDEIELRSGLDFLWEVEDVEENRIEKTTNITWATSYFNK